MDALTYQEGQPRLATVTLTVADGTTVAALIVISPLGVETSIAASPVPDTSFLQWEADATYPLAAGETIERWQVTGTGATEIDHLVWANARADAEVTGQRVYATSADYARIIKPATAPAGLRRALAAASALVDEMLWCAVYATDSDKMPTDPEVITALRDATCLQAEFAGTTGDRHLVGATKPAGFSIGKISVQKPPSAAGGPGGLGPRGEWSPRAWARLADAGLTNHEPWS